MWWRSATRVRAATTTDGHGNTVPDWTDTTSATIDDVKIQPVDVSEETTVRDGRVSLYRLLSKPGTAPDVLASDRITYGGVTYGVQGDPLIFGDPAGAGTHHIEARLRVVSG